MIQTTIHVTDIDSAKAARDIIYANKKIFFTVVLPTQEDADMFYMDYVHAPAENFAVVAEVTNAAE